MIICFDLAEEKFCKSLSLPFPPGNDGFCRYCYIGVLDGCLCFAINRRINEAICPDLWLLKKNDNKEREEHQSGLWSG